MIIAFPNDGTGNLYYVINMYGHTVHAYRDRQAAERSLEGQQRICTRRPNGTWDRLPAPHPIVAGD